MKPFILLLALYTGLSGMEFNGMLINQMWNDDRQYLVVADGGDFPISIRPDKTFSLKLNRNGEFMVKASRSRLVDKKGKKIMTKEFLNYYSVIFDSGKITYIDAMRFRFCINIDGLPTSGKNQVLIFNIRDDLHGGTMNMGASINNGNQAICDLFEYSDRLSELKYMTIGNGAKPSLLYYELSDVKLGDVTVKYIDFKKL